MVQIIFKKVILKYGGVNMIFQLLSWLESVLNKCVCVCVSVCVCVRYVESRQVLSKLCSSFRVGHQLNRCQNIVSIRRAFSPQLIHELCAA